MPNIEIKARYPDLDKARAIARAMRARAAGIDRQKDTYFFTRKGRLKLRESSLSGAQLIPYLRPARKGPKRSEYSVIPLADPALCRVLLGELLGAEVVVDKVREIFLIGNVRVHLDRVAGLGNFFEFEAVYEDRRREGLERRKVSELMRRFGIFSKDLLTGSYRELMLSARRGGRARRGF